MSNVPETVVVSEFEHLEHAAVDAIVRALRDKDSITVYLRAGIPDPIASLAILTCRDDGVRQDRICEANTVDLI